MIVFKLPSIRLTCNFSTREQNKKDSAGDEFFDESTPTIHVHGDRIWTDRSRSLIRVDILLPGSKPAICEACAICLPSTQPKSWPKFASESQL